MLPSSVLGNISALNLEDVAKFLKVFEKANGASYDQYKTIKELFAGLGPHSTTVGQMTRVLEGLLDVPAKKIPGNRFDLLFRELAPGATLVPTEASRVLYKRFSMLLELYRHARNEFTQQPTNTKTQIHAAGAQTLVLRLLAAIFSNWNRTFPEYELHLEVDNTRDLLPRLHVGLVDFILSYGPRDEKSIPLPRQEGLIGADSGQIRSVEYDVRFTSLGYKSRMVLLCPKNVPLPTKSRGEINLFGYEEKYQKRLATLNAKMKKSGEHRDLKRIPYDYFPSDDENGGPGFADLAFSDIDFYAKDSPSFIYIPTSWQPQVVIDTAYNLKTHFPERHIEVPWLDTALAFVRMQQGIAIASEVFALRSRVNVFRLRPENEYTKWIGVLYNTKNSLTRPACSLIQFIRDYLQRFENELRTWGTTPTFPDPSFRQWEQEFIKTERDWDAILLADYPKIP